MMYQTVLILTLMVSWIAVDGYTYMAIVTNTIRPNSKLKIPIKFNQVVGTQHINVKLYERNYDMPPIADVTYVVMGVTEVTVSLQVPSSISWGNYPLNITGSGTINFKNSTTLYGSTKAVSLFIQTDKAIYKPGDTVRYRVFAVNGSLTPITTNLDVEVFDPKDNKIAEQIGVSSAGSTGISGELPLSDMPPLGSWRIKVTAQDLGKYASETYRFEVKEYVLPKFEVSVKLPSYGLTTGTYLPVTVKAKYVFGKPVKGTVILDISRRYGSNFYDISSARTEANIDGEVTVNVPRDILERLTRNFDFETFVVDANVTETLTGITQTGSDSIQYYKQPYQLEFYPNLPDNYKPMDTTYNVVLKVSTRDGKPPIDVTEKVKVDVSFFLDKDVSVVVPNNLTFANYELIAPFIPGKTVLLQTKMYAIDADGIVRFSFEIPPNTATIAIKAEFAGEKRFKEISRFRSPAEVYTKVEMKNTGALKIGDMAHIEVTSNKGHVTAFYFIKSKGLIVSTGSVQIKANKKGMLNLKLTRDMAPSSRLVVYYVDVTNEIVADGLNFIVEDMFENKVTVEFDQNSSVEPGTSVNLKVKADTGSIVNVLAVDKSVRIMKEGNDITQDRVSEELRQYGDSPWFSSTSGWGRIAPWSFTGDDASAIFNNARVKVLTDAYLHEFNLWSLRQPKVRVASRAFAMDSAPMGMAESGMGGSSGPQGQIRKEFPESWIWKSAIAVNGMATFPDMAPDTMTTYVASAYALNDNSGLGVAPNTADLLVSLPLFVSMQLPYDVTRGEVAVIQANIFTNYTTDVYVKVTLKSSDQFDAITIDASNKEIVAPGDQEKCVLVKANTPTPVFFNIRPKKLGTLTVNVTALAASKNRFDTVVKEIPIKAGAEEKDAQIPELVVFKTVYHKPYIAEGEQKEANIPELVVFKTISNSETTNSWPVQAVDVVNGSEATRFTVIGDMFGPSFKNLDKLIKLPYGCGEQNMLNFAPSVFTAVYMNATSRLDKDEKLKKKIVKALKTGYQRQLLYQRRDGSFSAFGNADEEGSLWLTAFVVKSFAQANKLNMVTIDPKMFIRAVQYILKRQAPEGRFRSSGILFHKAMQGASASSNRSLTAYVSITLQEAMDSGLLDDIAKILVTDSLRNSTTYLKSQITHMNTDYEAAIGGYALSLSNDSDASTLLNKLETSSNLQTTNKEKYWENPSNSLKLEIASYALMIYARNMVTDQEVMKILKFLIGNRGPFGGYSSTQDTVIAVQATSEFAALIYTSDVDLNIEIRLDGALTPDFTFNVDNKNQDILQFRDAGKFDTVKITAHGKGTVMVDVAAETGMTVFVFTRHDKLKPRSYEYSVSIEDIFQKMECVFNITRAYRRFILSREITKGFLANIFYNVFRETGSASYIVTLKSQAADKNNYMVTACAKYNIPNSQSNMAIMDIGMLSGFEAVKDRIVKTPLMKRIEESAGRIVIYFDEIPAKEVCVDVPAQRVSLVSSVKPATVLVYSYYEPSERKMSTYLPDLFKTGNICDICGTECGCGATPTSMAMCVAG